jgi:hypothetical protein
MNGECGMMNHSPPARRKGHLNALFPRASHVGRTLRRSPPKSTIEDLPRPILPAPNEVKSPAPAVVVERWCGLGERMDRRALDQFTRDIWRRFDHRDLEPLKAAILRRRRTRRRSAWRCSIQSRSG